MYASPVFDEVSVLMLWAGENPEVSFFLMNIKSLGSPIKLRGSDMLGTGVIAL